jgi:hypothetical protein
VEKERPDLKHIHWELSGDLVGYEKQLGWILAEQIQQKPLFVSVPFHRIMEPYLRPWYRFEEQGVMVQVRRK